MTANSLCFVSSSFGHTIALVEKGCIIEHRENSNNRSFKLKNGTIVLRIDTEMCDEWTVCVVDGIDMFVRNEHIVPS